MLGLSNQRYTSACLCGVNICRNSNIQCKTFFFSFCLFLLFCLSPLVPCQNMQYINKARGQTIEQHSHFSSSHLVPFPSKILKKNRDVLWLLSQSYCCKCLDISKLCVNKVFFISHDDKAWCLVTLKMFKWAKVYLTIWFGLLTYGWDACDTFIIKSSVCTCHCSLEGRRMNVALSLHLCNQTSDQNLDMALMSMNSQFY